MSWTAGVTRTTGQLVTAAQWNSYLGASGSLDFLLAEHDNCSWSDVSGSRAMNTQYQNGAKIRVVSVCIICSPNEWAKILIGSASASSEIGHLFNQVNNLDALYLMATFIVPASWYYKVTQYHYTPTLYAWNEWNLL